MVCADRVDEINYMHKPLVINLDFVRLLWGHYIDGSEFGYLESVFKIWKPPLIDYTQLLSSKY